jgi:hypothetical protein
MHPCSSAHIPESVAIPVQVGMDSTEDSRLETLISDVEEQIQIIESYQTAVHPPSSSPPRRNQSECYQKLRQTCMHPTPQQALCMVGFGACIFFFGIVFPISIS